MLCPSCASPTSSRTFDGHYGRTVLLDICGGCQGLWFDEQELLQLSPGGTLALFRVIAEMPSPARPAGSRPRCPRCSIPLVQTADLQRNTRFHYLRCPRGHGRFMTFFQFLRARSFVRTLSDPEIRALREHVRQVNCSNCGAPVDVDRGAVCAHCRTAISIMDPDQLETTLAALDAAEMRRQQIDPTLPVRLLHERLRVERVFAGKDTAGLLGSLQGGSSADLVREGLSLLRRWLR